MKNQFFSSCLCVFLIDESSQAYSRLNSTDNNNDTKSSKVSSLPKRTSMWFKNKAPSLTAANLSKSISKLNKNISNSNGNDGNGEMEKEWLLLGEPSSPTINHADQENINVESSILSDSTDTDCIMKAENNSESDDSEEDIDSVVEEYQQKVKVTTAGLKDTNIKLPSIGSWRISLFCLFSVIVSATIAALSALWELLIPFSLSLAGKRALIFKCAIVQNLTLNL